MLMILYLSMKPDETNRLVRLQACLKDVKTWMTQNCLLLNSDKTEVVLFGPERFREKFAILTCCVIESPIRMVSIPFCAVSIASVALTLVVAFGLLLIFWIALG